MITLDYLPRGATTPLRVCAYIRVSSDDEDQESSFAAQNDFFRSEIASHPDWESEGIYADYAKSGTQIKGRLDFQRMMRDAEEHRFNYILTKSISRFSRNVADALKTLRQLKAWDVGVFFLEQNISSLQPECEFVLSLLSAIAAQESESISENTMMTLDEMNKRGTPLRKCSYGYVKDPVDKSWAVDHAAALRVKLSFRMAAFGYGFSEIARRLNEIEEYENTSHRWRAINVKSMLLSETYVGDILTNKTAVVRDKTGGKRQMRNEGLKDQYKITDHHAPIVGRKLGETIRQYTEAGLLGGQDNFVGDLKSVRKIAIRDPLLADVKGLMPVSPPAPRGKFKPSSPSTEQQHDKGALVDGCQE